MKDEHFIDYDDVEFFDISDKRWVLLRLEDGGTTFINSDKVSRFAHIPTSTDS